MSNGLSDIISPATTPIRPQLTLQQKQQRMFQSFKLRSSQTFQQVVTTFKWGWDQVWNNPDGLSPQEAFDAMGAAAVQSLQASTLTAKYINSVIPGTIPVSEDGTPITPKPLSVDQTGRVVVGS